MRKRLTEVPRIGSPRVIDNRTGLRRVWVQAVVTNPTTAPNNLIQFISCIWLKYTTTILSAEDGASARLPRARVVPI